MSIIEQIEIEQLKEELKEARESISWWNRRYNTLNKCNNEKKDRIHKLIEYINNLYKDEYISYGTKEEMLNIIRGVDNE